MSIFHPGRYHAETRRKKLQANTEKRKDILMAKLLPYQDFAIQMLFAVISVRIRNLCAFGYLEHIVPVIVLV
jgi:hypothetical protein